MGMYTELHWQGTGSGGDGMNDHWEPILRDWLPDRLLAGGCPIRTIELIEVARGDARSTIDAMRVTTIMRAIGWTRRRNAAGVRGWWPGEAT
jgi:hypothetical protein